MSYIQTKKNRHEIELGLMLRMQRDKQSNSPQQTAAMMVCKIFLTSKLGWGGGVHTFCIFPEESRGQGGSYSAEICGSHKYRINNI